MQSNTLRSVTLALLMIASVMVPLADISSEPPEMMEERVALEAPPVPCLGNDACRGTDAGNTYATAIDISNDFDWNGANETNTYWGSMTATSYSSTNSNLTKLAKIVLIMKMQHDMIDILLQPYVWSGLRIYGGSTRDRCIFNVHSSSVESAARSQSFWV